MPCSYAATESASGNSPDSIFFTNSVNCLYASSKDNFLSSIIHPSKLYRNDTKIIRKRQLKIVTAPITKKELFAPFLPWINKPTLRHGRHFPLPTLCDINYPDCVPDNVWILFFEKNAQLGGIISWARLLLILFVRLAWT